MSTLWCVSLLGLVCATCGAAAADETKPLIGAIRWDAWHVAGEGSPVKAMERSLGPKQYHYRLPFFAKVVSESEVRIDGYTQKIVDQEIAYAKAGGIDYWAFLLYDPDSPMSQGLSLYLSSKRKKDVRFCAIASPNVFRNAEQFPKKMQRVVDLMAEPTYQKVAGDRPLLYLFGVSDEWLQAWGGEANAKRLFDGLRAAVKARGLKEPYIVVMDFHPAHGKNAADAIGAEAISTYATAGGAKGRTPYATLTSNAKHFWDSCASTGAQVVPTAMAGWDRRPRVEHPVPWQKNQKPGEGIEKYFQMPTPKELAAHIEDAMRWVIAKPDRCPAQTIIIYAWNEHDEGGWLCPTLSEGPARLDAISKLLRPSRLACTSAASPNTAPARP